MLKSSWYPLRPPPDAVSVGRLGAIGVTVCVPLVGVTSPLAAAGACGVERSDSALAVLCLFVKSDARSSDPDAPRPVRSPPIPCGARRGSVAPSP